MGTPTAHHVVCNVCNKGSAIYKCPRCAIRTCSLPCSRTHKTSQSCSGERDKIAYVPMNKYGWGTMMNDYVYLEEVGRKVTDWGREIIKDRLLDGAAIGVRGCGRGRGRGRGARNGGSRGKRDLLKLQLDARDIEVETLPAGMEKRRLNQSTWDVRSKSPLLTIEFVFHAARDVLVPGTSPPTPPVRFLTHRNTLNRTLLDTVQKHIIERGKKENLPPWIQDLGSNSEGGTPLYLIVQNALSTSHSASKQYQKLDATQHLSAILRHKSFVEFPIIDIWEDGAFNGPYVETDGTLIEGEDTPPLAKRRRLDNVAGSRMLHSLLGDYKSEGEDEQGEEKNVLAILDDYISEGEDSDQQHLLTPEADYADEEYCDDEEPSLEGLGDILEAIPNDCIETQFSWSEDDDGGDLGWDDSGEEEAKGLERTLRRATRQPE